MPCAEGEVKQLLLDPFQLKSFYDSVIQPMLAPSSISLIG